MAASIAQLQVVVKGDTQDAEKKLGDVNDKVEKSGGFFRDALKNALSFAGGAAIVSGVGTAVGFVKDQLVDIVKAGADAEQAQAQLAQGLLSTKDASGETVQGLEDLADQYSNVTTYSKTAIEQSEAITLTFTNIGKDVFPQATMAAEDLATRMGEDLPSATLQLDKALGDPIKGYAQLQRVGVVFTAQQVDQIKTMSKAGDVAGAQKIILGELSKEFGGSATAAGKTFAGQMSILGNKLEDTKEKIGEALIPVLSKMLTAIMPLINSLGTLISQGLSALSGFITSTVVPALSGLTPMLSGLGDSMENIVGPAAADMGIIISQAAQTAGPILSTLGTIFKQDIMPAVRQLLPVVTGLALSVGQTLGGIIRAILPVLKSFGDWFLKEGVPALKSLAQFIEKNVLPVLATIVEAVVKNVVPAVQSMADAVIKNVLPAVENLWNMLAPKLVPIITTLAHILGVVIPPIFKVVTVVIGDVVNAITTLVSWISTVIGWFGTMWDFLKKVGDWIGGVFTSTINGISTLFSNVFNGLIDIVKAPFNLIIDGLNILINGLDLIQFNVPSWIPFIGGKTFGFDIPDIPHMAQGGTVTTQGIVEVGENGPETLVLPRGAQVIPGVSPAALSTAAQGGGTVSPAGAGAGAGVVQNIYLCVDGRTLTQTVLKNLPREVRLATGMKI